MKLKSPKLNYFPRLSTKFTNLNFNYSQQFHTWKLKNQKYSKELYTVIWISIRGNMLLKIKDIDELSMWGHMIPLMILLNSLKKLYSHFTLLFLTGFEFFGSHLMKFPNMVGESLIFPLRFFSKGRTLQSRFRWCTIWRCTQISPLQRNQWFWKFMKKSYLKIPILNYKLCLKNQFLS